MRCPIDETELRPTERQGIEIDYCPQCRGVWLDRGELDKLIERGAQYAGGDRTEAAGRRDPYAAGTYDRSGPPDRDDDDRRRFDGDDRRGYPAGAAPDPRRRKRKGFLGDIFDFDDS